MGPILSRPPPRCKACTKKRRPDGTPFRAGSSADLHRMSHLVAVLLQMLRSQRQIGEIAADDDFIFTFIFLVGDKAVDIDAVLRQHAGNILHSALPVMHIEGNAGLAVCEPHHVHEGAQDIPRGDDAHHSAHVAHHGEAADVVPFHQIGRLLDGGLRIDGNHPLRHDVLHHQRIQQRADLILRQRGRRRRRYAADVAVAHQTHQLAALQHGQAVDLVRLHDRRRLGHRRVRRNGDRIL